MIAELFARGVTRTTRIGIEHELVPADRTTAGVVPIERTRAAVEGLCHVGFEPGGQVELSLPCAGPADLAGAVGSAIAEARSACAHDGIELRATPTDPRGDVPLQLRTRRYLAMQGHFDSIGAAGRRMMRRTASTQVCLDWWPGRAGAEQWRLLNLAAPFLAASYARESGGGSRLATWLQVDPTRTAFDGRLLVGDDPVAAYGAFARGATRFTEPHLTTLFPPVRPRGHYLEVRFPDVQEDEGVVPMALSLARLVYDDEVRARTLDQLRDDAPRLEQHWHDAAHGAGEVRERGRRLLAAAPDLVGAA